jgi:gliding motility-associated-like protein
LVQDINLTINELPTITLADVMDCVGEEGTLTPVVTTPAASYDLLWFDNSTHSSITLTEPREGVEVTVTDSNGCKAEATASFGWYAETLFEQDTILACYAGTIVVTIDEENQFENFVWGYEVDPTDPASPGIVPLNPSNQTAVERVLTIQAATNTDAWSGRYHVKADDFNACPVEGYFDLIITPIPDLQLIQPEISVSNPSMCQGDTITITYTDIYDRQFTNFEWSFRENTSDPYVQIKDGLQPWVEAFEEGQYYLYASMNNGCDAEGDVNVTTVDSPDFELSSQEACPDTDIELAINPGTYVSNYGSETSPARYEWLQVPPGLENAEITNQFQIVSDEATYNVNEANRGYYRLTAFNSMGCFASKFASATSLDVTPVILEDVEICSNNSYTLTIPSELASLGGSYQWYQETEANDIPAPFVNSPWDLGEPNVGVYTYRLEYTNPSGCSSNGTMTLTVLPSPEFNLPTGEICEGETITISAKDSYDSYVWNGVAGGNTYQVNTTENISLVVTDENGCVTTRTTSLTTRPLPVVSIEDAEACPDDIITLSVPYSADDYNILWTLPSGRTVRNTNSIHTVEGTYSVMVVDELGCAGRDQATVSWKDFPWVYFGPNIVNICPVNLPVSIEAQGDRESWIEMHWHDGQYENQHQRIANLSDTVNVIRVMNNDNCWSRASQSVLLAIPTIYETGRDIEGCEPTDGVPFNQELDGGTFTLYETSDFEPLEVPIQSYRWYETVNNADLGSNQTVTATESGQYVIEIFDGCWMHTDTFNIDLYPNPVIAGIDSTIYRQVVVFAEGGTEPYTYTLNDMQPQNEMTFKNLENGDYTVYVIDMHGCEASTSFLFESNYDIKVPNFFTPNGDGYNDTWVIEGIEKLPESIIYIYDRYGKLLKKYGSNDPAWNGEYLNQPVPSDDYWYVIHLLPVDKYIKGNFTLKR